MNRLVRKDYKVRKRVRIVDEINIINNEIHRLMVTYPGHVFDIKMRKMADDEEHHRLVMNQYGDVVLKL